MDATEYQLKAEISALRERIGHIEYTLEEKLDDKIKEIIRQVLLESHLIQPAAEDE